MHILEIVAFMAASQKLKQVFLQQGKEFKDSFKYMLIAALQSNTNVKAQNVASILLFSLNMARSDAYGIMVPSHQLEADEKDASYYELQQL